MIQTNLFIEQKQEAFTDLEDELFNGYQGRVVEGQFGV